MLAWPDGQFEIFNLAFRRRKAVEEVNQRKILNIALFTSALYANPNWDGDSTGKRAEAIKEYSESLERECQKIIRQIYGATDVDEMDKVDWDDPFFSSMKLEYNPETGEKLGEAKTVAEMREDG